MVAVSHPTTLAQALDTLASGEHILFAGGTDLMVRCRVRPNVPAEFHHHVVFTDRVAELKQISPAMSADGNLVRIGAAVTMAEALRSPLVPNLLKQSLSGIAAPALRNRATLAGNICNASPAADTLPPLYLLDARVVLAKLGEQRTLPIGEFILSPGKTALTQGEMLTHIELPQPSELPLCHYHKVGTRAANALTKVAFAGLARIDAGIVTDWRVAFGAVAPTVVRDRALEALVIGQPVSQLSHPETGLCQALLHAYGQVIRPIDDQRSTAQYRHTTALNLLQRFNRLLVS